jgi:hypothetical protein
MTPIAVTPAAREKKAKPRRSATGSAAPRPAGAGRSGSAAKSRGATQTGRSTGHKRTASSSPAPRRVSGPAGGIGTSRRPAPARPDRRTSGPARRTAQRPPLSRAISARMGRFVRGLPDHPLLDQIVRGRAWIPLLGILLAGIVAMQVEVLKLSANMGRSLERGTALQSRNEQLRASVAQLGDDQLIERIAASMGMVMPPPAAVKFLASRPAGQMGRALAGIHAPNPTAYAASVQALQTAATAAAVTTATGPTVGTVPTAASTAAAPTTVAPTTAAPAAAAPTTPTTTPGVPASTPTTSSTVAPTGTAAPASVAPSTGTAAAGAVSAGAPATSTGG